MGQRRNAKSVANFVVFLLILQNCGQARTQPEIEPDARRDGLAKFQFSGSSSSSSSSRSRSSSLLQPAKGADNDAATPAPAPSNVFNFAKIYETLYAQFMWTAAGAERGRGRELGHGRGRQRPQTQLLWEAPQTEVEVGAPPVVVITSPKPFVVLQQLQHDFEQELERTTTVKPFSVLQQLSLDQIEQLRHKHNASFNILQALQAEQERRNQLTTTMKPFHVLQQLDKDLQQQLDKHVQQQQPQQLQPAEGAFEVLEPVAEPLEQHKAVPAESTRAKDSQKRKRKRIRRRRKRIRRRRKRKRRRNRKQRKKKRKKRKKRKRKKGDKDKKKRKKRKKRKKEKPATEAPLIGQQAQLIYANPTKQPHHNYQHHQAQPLPPVTQIFQLVTTTKRPATTTTLAPFSKLKFLLNHKSLFKKKKKEYLSHVGHVIYPFIKFVAFFTVLNPFTLGVFLFTLISPVVFGFIGFVALSILVKPFLHLVFGVKENVDAIELRHRLANKRAEQLKLALRPVTIHKHYYQQKPHRYRPAADWRRRGTDTSPLRHNPLLPEQREALYDER